MKDDLISREALLEEFRWLASEASEARAAEYDEIIARIEAAEAVEAEPVVHAHWVPVECGTLCSHCHRVFDHHFEVNHYRCVEFKRCPDCGAHMDKEVIE